VHLRKVVGVVRIVGAVVIAAARRRDDQNRKRETAWQTPRADVIFPTHSLSSGTVELTLPIAREQTMVASAF
jgi:hypothetical protein